MTNEPGSYEPPVPPPPPPSSGESPPPPPPPPNSTPPPPPPPPSYGQSPPEPPAYGSTQYGQPPAGPPPPPPTGPYGGGGYGSVPGGRDNTVLYGVLGIVIAVICCAPLGILFGYLSMQEAKKHDKDPTLGRVGFWLGIVLTALGVIAAILGLCFGAFGSWGVVNNHDVDPYN